MVPSTDVSANTDEPATDVANGTGCATMNRRKVATPRRHRLRSVVSGTCGFLVWTAGQATGRADNTRSGWNAPQVVTRFLKPVIPK